jgi:tetratricopeptide (TPR) repeat protein
LGGTNLPAAVKKVLQPPPGTGALFEEARRAADAGRLQEAEQKFLQVLRQDENNLSTLSFVIYVQTDLKRYDEAEKNLAHALSLDPQDPAILFSLGRLRFHQNKYDEALDAFSKSASLDPNRYLTQYMLGQTLLQKQNLTQAEKALRKALQLNPRSGDAHYSLAVVYATQKPPFKELAQWHYTKALNAGVPANPSFEKQLLAKPDADAGGGGEEKK